MINSFINTSQLLFLLLVLQAGRYNSYGGTVNDSTQSPTGIYIHGTMGISDGTGITVFGDLYLDSANLTGNGTLTMQSSKPKSIVALHSQINNLSIDNPTTVTLRGDLRIVHSLTIDQGTFDATAASLDLRTATITLRHHASIRQAPTLLHDALPTHASNNHILYNACLKPTNIALLTQTVGIAPSQDKHTIAQWINTYHQTTDKPPEFFKCLMMNYYTLHIKHYTLKLIYNQNPSNIFILMQGFTKINNNNEII